MNLPDISAHWVALHKALGLGAPIADEAHYERMLEAVGALMEDVGRFRAVGGLGGAAGRAHPRVRGSLHPWPDSSTPATVLGFLMAEHGLRQSELPEIGSQGVVSEVLSGRRALNLRQVKALARRFAVPMDVLT